MKGNKIKPTKNWPKFNLHLYPNMLNQTRVLCSIFNNRYWCRHRRLDSCKIHTKSKQFGRIKNSIAASDAFSLLQMELIF